MEGIDRLYPPLPEKRQQVGGADSKVVIQIGERGLLRTYGGGSQRRCHTRGRSFGRRDSRIQKKVDRGGGLIQCDRYRLGRGDIQHVIIVFLYKSANRGRIGPNEVL